MRINVYTRDDWLSYTHKFPCFVIDEDGLIYNGADFRLKLIKYPIGRVDFKRGEIYGKNFRSSFALPTMYIREGVNVTEIYDGDDYRHKFVKYPLGYVRNKEYYTYDDFHHFFRYPTYHIEVD